MTPRPRKRWSHSVGRYGQKVRIYEPRLGAPLRWDYRQDDQRQRPEVEPPIRIRPNPKAAEDPIRIRAALEACEHKAAELTLQPLRKAVEPESLTVGEAYALYFDRKRRALPPSKSARIHHTASRDFWENELGRATPWDAIKPADAWSALVRLKERKQVATAEKRYANLRTLFIWLRDQMGYDAIRNPLRKLDKRKLVEGYTVRRPRYSGQEIERIIEASRDFDARMHLFTVLMADSGARAMQIRHAMRSGFNCELEPPVPAGHAPSGWLLFAAVKGQDAMLTYLTVRQRGALDAALAGYLADWETAYQQNSKDYPLIPGGRLDRKITAEPISDRALRKLWPLIEDAADIPHRSRRAFHGSRRAWADDIEESLGIGTVTAAGGWSRQETPESLYVSKRKYGHLERARVQRERV